MKRELTTLHFHSGSLTLGSYGLLLTLALAVGALLALSRGKRAGLEEGALISTLGLAVGAGFLGAFACSVAVRFVQLGSLSAALAAPGIVFYGAMAGGALGLAVGARSFGLPVLATWDAMLPALPLAHALGRIGCLLGGCCFGAPSALPWAVRYPGESFTRHPWPLYEAAALLVLAACFWRPRSTTPGRRALTYVLCYACLRLVLEPLRGDAIRGVFFGLSSSQLISLLAIAASSCGLKKLRPAALSHAAGHPPRTGSLTA